MPEVPAGLKKATDGDEVQTGPSPSRISMKGIVFTEFLEQVENDHGIEIADRIIRASSLESEGAYTSIGTYDWRELVRLADSLSALTGEDLPVLLNGIGHNLLGRFVEQYPQFFEGVDHPLDLLEQVEVRKAEMLKLDRDFEIPVFEYERVSTDHLVMIYPAPSLLPDFAEGLMRGCGDHFGRALSIERDGSTGSAIHFDLRCKSASE